MENHPEIVEKIKQEFYTGDFKNPGWENEVGYPVEEFIQDCFAEYADRIMRDYVMDITKGVLNRSQSLSELSDKVKEEAVAIISSRISDYIDMSGEIKYGDKDKIIRMVKAAIKTFDVKEDLKFNETYLVGKLINILGTEENTEMFISSLSMLFTDKYFSTQFGGEELVEIFQSIRPALIKLYRNKTSDEFYEWFREGV